MGTPTTGQSNSDYVGAKIPAQANPADDKPEMPTPVPNVGDRQQSQIDPIVQRILDQEQAKDKRITEGLRAFKEEDKRILRAKTAWLRVASFWGDAIPQGLIGDPLWRNYAERIVDLGQVLRENIFYEDPIAPGPPAKQIAVEILRQARNGEIDNVTALLKAFEDTRYTVGTDADNWLRVGLMYEFLPIAPPAAVGSAEEPMPDDAPDDNVPFIERLKKAAANPGIRDAWQQERARRVEAAMYVGGRDEVELGHRVEAALHDASDKGMSVDEANDKAKKLVEEMGKAFFVMSKRKQVKLIGCHIKTWKKTPLFQEALKKGKITPPKPKAAKVSSLTSACEAVTGEGDRDEVLKQLIADQETDKEPSPLESDPPNSPRKIHSRKRL